jgi:hypothetical protein
MMTQNEVKQEHKYHLSLEVFIYLLCKVRERKSLLTVIMKATVPRMSRARLVELIISNQYLLLPGFDPRLHHVGFVKNKVALGLVFFECFGVPCQFPLHQLLQNSLIIYAIYSQY